MEKAIPRDVFFTLGKSGLVKGTLIHEYSQPEPIILPSLDESDGFYGTKGPQQFSQVVVSHVEKAENHYKPGDIVTLASSMVFDIE